MERKENHMKSEYCIPEIEILEISSRDVIVASNDDVIDPEQGWLN